MSGEAFFIDFSIEGDIEQQFKDIANRLMNEAVIIVDETVFCITEIEFYLFHPKMHPDPFVHCHERQKTSMQWYFHESGYGVDLTFGNPDFYGGILIRGIWDIKSGSPYSGPWKSMYALLSAMNGASMPESKRFIVERYDHAERLEPIPRSRINLWIPGVITAEMFAGMAPQMNDSERKRFYEVYSVQMDGVFKRKEGLSKAENRKAIEGISLFKNYYDREYGYYIDNNK